MDVKEKLKELLETIPTLKEGFNKHDKVLREAIDTMDKFYEEYEEMKDAVENDLMDLIKQLIDKVNDLESKIDALTQHESNEQSEQTMEEQVQEDEEKKDEQEQQNEQPQEQQNEEPVEEEKKFEEQEEEEQQEEQPSEEEKKEEEEEKPLPQPPVSSESVKPIVSDFKEYVSREEIAKEVFRSFIQ